MVQTLAPDVGGVDHIQTGTGSAVIMGGAMGDVISTVLPGDTPDPNNTNFVLGDNGFITWVGQELRPAGVGLWPGADHDPSDIDLVSSTDFDIGGNDRITIGSGRAIVIGGKGDDTITGGSTTNVMLGDSGAIYAAASNAPADRFGSLPITLGMVQTLAPSIGGVDHIQTGTGSAVIMGGAGDDTISTVLATDTPDPTNTNFVLGDNGFITWVGQELRPAGVGLWPGADTNASDIDLVTSTDFTYGGDDTITIGSGRAIVIGGKGDDTILGGSTTNVMLGDSGAIYAAASDADRFGALPITLGMVRTLAPDIGGVDHIQTGTGSAVIMGGSGSDTISTVVPGVDPGTDNTNFVLGDNGFITWVGTELNPSGVAQPGNDADPSDIDIVASTDFVYGGDDKITIGSGRAIVIGGQGSDTITGGSGTNVILGDSGSIYAASNNDAANRFGSLPITLGMVQTTSPGAAFGGDDHITTLDGDAIVMGGTGNDVINTGAGTNIAFGDDGFITWVGSELNPSMETWSGQDLNPADIDMISSTTPDDGGNDAITVGAGDAIIVGGYGDDHIHGGSASNIIMGDSGTIYAAFDSSSGYFGSSKIKLQLQLVRSIAPAIGGIDDITGGRGQDLIVGGIGSDTIDAGEGDNLVIGDNGEFEFDTTNGKLIRGATIAPEAGGGVDSITTGAGRDVVLGGLGTDTINAGAGDNVVFGDDGVARFDPAILVHMLSTETDQLNNGNDWITTLGGRDVIVGGGGSDHIFAGEGDNVVFGDSAELDFFMPDSVLRQADSLDPSHGGEDSITTGTDLGRDIVVGGFGVDHIVAGGGDNVIAGDSASMTFDSAGILHFFKTIAPDIGGNDDISLTTGNNIVFAGAGSDTVTIGQGSNIVFGDNGQVGWDATRATGFLDATDPTLGGLDTITVTGSGNNWIIGGTGGDHITTGSGDDIVFGDFASFAGELPTVPVVPYAPVHWTYTSTWTTVDPAIGSNDVIDAGDGRNIVFGGQGSDTITTGSGQDDIAGGSNVALAHDGNDVIVSGSGDDVVAGDNASILPNGGVTSPLDRSLTAPTIYSPVANADGTFTYLPNTSAAGVFDPSHTLLRTLVVFDGGTSAVAGNYGNDTITTGDGNDLAFGQMGDDSIRAGNGNDYVEGGGGADLIYGGSGQDDLIGGSSDLFGYLTRDQRQYDGTDVIYGDNGDGVTIDNPGDTSADGHSHNADVIAGDNARIVRLVNGHSYLTFNYDNYAGETEHIVPRAVQLLDYSPTGEASYTTCDPLYPATCWIQTGTGQNVGGADFLYGEAGNDIVYGEGGSDTIFGGAQDDTLYGNAGGDWIDGGAGDDGVLGDDGLLLLARNGVAEPLYGLAATTQATLGAEGEHGNEEDGSIGITVNVVGHLNYTAIEQPFYVGGNDIVYGGLGDDFLHGGAGDDAMSGAEALASYYTTSGDPLAYLASLVTAGYYAQGNVLGYNALTQLFRYFDPAHPFAKIMLPNGIDFLLNFTSATAFDPASFPASHVQPVRDDGQDVLFGDSGNDWLVGGTNQDVIFGGWGNDLLQADDSLDSTKTTTPVSYASVCTLGTSYSSSSHEASELCSDLTSLQSRLSHMSSSQIVDSLDGIAEEITSDIGEDWSTDEAGTLIRLIQALKPGYSQLANNIVDPRGGGVTFADIAYGGAGHDILIANSASDRLLDWHDDANAYYVPWETNGESDHGDGTVIVDDPSEEIAQLLLDLGLALGADPTRPEVAVPYSSHDWESPSFRNGEPFGELGLVVPHDGSDDHDWSHDWGQDSDWNWSWPWHGGVNPGLDVEGGSDTGEAADNEGNHGDDQLSQSLGLIVTSTPSVKTEQIEDFNHEWWHDGHWSGDDETEALLHRIVIRGQLTVAEQALLSTANREILSRLLGCGWLATAANGDVLPTNQLWLATGLADAPTITSISNSRPALANSIVTLTGTGDPTDTITIWDNALMLGTGAIVDGTGHWTITVNLLTVGDHNVTATQTVNQLPQAGTLTSARSNEVDADVYPDAPRITFVSTPGPTTSSTPVTVSGTATQTYTVNLYDGSHFLASVIAGAGGAWTFTVNLSVGTHSLTVTQTSTTVPGGRYTSGPSSVASVTVYAPPSAPTLTGNINGIVSAGAMISGRAVALGNVEIYEGNAIVGTATVDAWGNWVSTLTVLSLGRHTLTMRVQDVRSTFWSGYSSSFTVTVVPNAPTIASVTKPAAPTTTTATVTVTGTGVAGYTVKVYDGTRYLGTATWSGNTWTYNAVLAVGSHSLTATQTSTPVAGVQYTSDTSDPWSMTVYAPTPAPTVSSSPANVFAGTTITVTGHGTAGATVKLYEGTNEIGTAFVGSNGNWTATVTLAGTGTHVLTAKQQDVASGFWSGASSSFSISAFLDPGAPAISTVSTPAKTHNTSSVTLTGTGIAGQTITIYDGSNAIKTVTVGAGTWTVSVSLGIGSHVLTATQSPATGLQSAPSAARTVTVLYG